jgi:hypothetical protein
MQKSSLPVRSPRIAVRCQPPVPLGPPSRSAPATGEKAVDRSSQVLAPRKTCFPTTSPGRTIAIRETAVSRRPLKDRSRVGDQTSQSAAGASLRRSAGVLDGPACQAEVGGSREHVAVVGPHIAFSDFVCCRKMHRVGGAYEEIAGSGNHERTGPSQQSFVDGN